MSKTTILVETATRKLLKQVGRKDQTYDTLIKELIFKSKLKTPAPKLKTPAPSDEGLEKSLPSNEKPN
jgi:hypothetical protein